MVETTGYEDEETTNQTDKILVCQHNNCTIPLEEFAG
jgi:hypothetical protein